MRVLRTHGHNKHVLMCVIVLYNSLCTMTEYYNNILAVYLIMDFKRLQLILSIDIVTSRNTRTPLANMYTKSRHLTSTMRNLVTDL